MYMSSTDKELAKKQEWARKRREEEKRRQRAAWPFVTSTSAVSEVCMMNQTESSDIDKTSDSDGEFQPRKPSIPTHNEQQLKASQLLTPHITSALDRNKTSDREAVRLMV